MTDYNATRQESNVRNTDPRPPRIFIGTADGYDHHFLPHSNEVVVVDAHDGRRVHRESLGAASVERWVIEIGDRDGWQRQNLYVDMADWLNDELEALA